MESMHLRHWPILRGGEDERHLDLLYGYKLLKYHFTQIYRERLIPGAATLAQVMSMEAQGVQWGHFEVQLSGAWEQDKLQLVERALRKGFTGRRDRIPLIQQMHERIVASFDLRY